MSVTRIGSVAAARYGALGLPLAFVALPLYVMLPNHYATQFGVPLAALGLLLLAARLFDALVDPWIGRLADAALGRSSRRAWWLALGASVALLLGFVLLFFPQVRGTDALLLWCGAALLLTYLGYSVVSVIHQAWGARLGGDELQRARVVSWREGLALVGVLLASVLPSLAGLAFTSASLIVLTLIGLWLLRLGPATQAATLAAPPISLALPFRSVAFRRLLAVYLCNGIASAVPATLVLFFVRDRLQLPQDEALFLGSYFAAAALSIALWLRCVQALGLARSWLLAMGLAVLSFGWALALGSGDRLGFLGVCIASGVALGADLAVPGAMLAGVIQTAGHERRAEGAYFGWWNFATKLNLALAAGLALPVLQWLGYAPGEQDATALSALSLVYCALPCALKLLAAGLLYGLLIRNETPR
ncbi:MAG: MFS transporter [Burkholderiaceae bacterium]|nr:MFS transporter [Burkholderiaceae bacterium]